MFISTLPLLVQVFWAKRATAVQMGNLRSANAAKKLMLRSMWSCLGFGASIKFDSSYRLDGLALVEVTVEESSLMRFVSGLWLSHLLFGVMSFWTPCFSSVFLSRRFQVCIWKFFEVSVSQLGSFGSLSVLFVYLEVHDANELCISWAQMFSIWRFWWTALQFINVRRYDSSPNSSGVRIRRPHHATMAPIPHCRVFLEYSLALFGASPPYFLLDSRVWREWERRHEVKWRWELFV